MLEALAIWKLYPQEIESDLTLRGIDFGRWLRGELSSRTFINILNGLLPEDESWFKLAVRRDAEREEKREQSAEIQAVQNRNRSELFRSVPGKGV